MFYKEFSVSDPFLTTFYYVEKRNGILHKNKEEGFEKSYVPYMEVGSVKNCQNHPYIINEWPLKMNNVILHISIGRKGPHLR